ncbi:sensor histidine kinase [Mucilaginibacter endophyticus]|uniref:sensor histidine kinase n=1 Tax=Mucilaginibacter endophyticus TaxID=2675003 RepID=UPI000E0DE6EC|nr:HAMP domain-containing sensor histidine kinase [Mucilaginibacter endophyticus]
MKKKHTITFGIAALTAFSILLFQSYWIYYNYSNAQHLFLVTATNALEKSIEKYQLQEIDLPTSLNYKEPSLTVFMKTLPDQDAVALDTPKSKRLFKAQMSTVAIDKENVPIVKALMARLLLQQSHKPLDLNALTRIYREELQKESIDVPFTLKSRRSPSKIHSNEIAARISYYKSAVVISATIESNRWLLRHNLLPALVSFLLIFLSAGSLWYMGLIIRRQLKLDRLKNQFIRNITHEFRTPMTILRSSNEAIAQFGIASDPEKLLRYTGINNAVLDKLENEVERILEISSLERNSVSVNWQIVDVPELMKTISKRFSSIGSDRLQLKFQTAIKDVKTDSDKLDTIISNLIDNALKYAGENAEVSVEFTVGAKNWQILVNDNGKGISPEDVPLIFDNFYRVDTGEVHDVKGYGLGLSHAKQLTELLNGKIGVESGLNEGTRFTIKFPLA